MNQATIDAISTASCLTLKRSFEIFGGEHPGLEVIVLEHPRCSASIALQGAQILSFQAHGQAPLLWLSPKASFIEGKAVRGGIPVCAPWFGPHTEDANKPQHGFARNLPWELSEVQQSDSDVVLRFQLSSSAAQLRLHPWPLKLTLEMTFSDSLNLNLSVEHLDGGSNTHSMPFSWALHTYFAVHDIAQTRIHGLDEEQDYTFQGEVDQVLTQVPEHQSIICDGMTGSIEIYGQHCPSAIVWNPGPEKAATMTDLGKEHYAGFVCVERGAAKADSWSIPVGKTRHAQLKLSREF